MNITREEANVLMRQWVSSESLRKHMYAVEAAMRAYAEKHNANKELWGITGLLHDFDYEKFPEYDSVAKTGHPFKGVGHLQTLGVAPEITDAILGHALYSGVPRVSDMAKVLFACDELCGFIVAVARMKPDGMQTLQSSSVIKKLKDKKFAEKVSREDIDRGVIELGISKEDHIDFVILSLRPISAELGLSGKKE